MMEWRLVSASVVGCFLLFPGFVTLAGKNRPMPATILPARTLSLQKETIALSEALTQVKKQTGITVADRRLSKNDPKLKLDLVRVPFWKALEVIAKEAKARVSPYQGDGIIALVEGPYRPLPIDFHGPFKVSVKDLVLKRNLESDYHSCVIHLEAAWEPWFQPFYLEAGPASVVFSPDAKGKVFKPSVPSRGQISVAGKTAIEVEFRFPAPKRSAAKIELLKGVFGIIGPRKMLTFSFPSLGPIKSVAMRKEQEGVAVSLTRIAVKSERWTFDVLIENPPGGPKFESYQSWLDNNQIYLEKGAGRDKEVFLPNPADEEALGNVTASRAAIRYHFTRRNDSRSMPGKISDWRLVYRTPGRIVEVQVPFEFRDVSLP
jgi:hypothetical protein